MDKKKINKTIIVKKLILYVIYWALICITTMICFYTELKVNKMFFMLIIILESAIYRFVNKNINGNININIKKIKKEEIIEKTPINEEKIKKQNEIDTRSQKIYMKYKKENYDIKDETTNEIICKSYNITKEELLFLYNRGKEIEQEQKLKKIISKREEEIAKNKREQEKISIFGKAKYLNLLNERYEGFETIQKMSRIMSDSLISGARQARNVKGSDPYVFGGIANGIAGPAAGIMTASRIQQENERRKEEGEIIAQNSLNSATRWSKEASNAEKVTVNIKNMIDNINDALIIEDTNQLTDKITFEYTNYDILETNNFLVRTEYSLSNLNILNKKALLDGSFKILILDEEENIVATGYYSAGNVDVDEFNSVNTTNMGLNRKDEFEVICISTNPEKVNSEKEYQIMIEPINLWLMEINW